MASITLRIEIEQEDDGRVLVVVVTDGFDGCMDYGSNEVDAQESVRQLVCAVIADRLKDGESVSGLIPDDKDDVTVVFVV